MITARAFFIPLTSQRKVFSRKKKIVSFQALLLLWSREAGLLNNLWRGTFSVQNKRKQKESFKGAVQVLLLNVVTKVFQYRITQTKFAKTPAGNATIGRPV